MKTFKTEGVTIRRRNFGEADRIVTIFTPHYGKITVKAVGVRKITSRRKSHIELLNHSLFSLYKGRSMAIVTEVQTVNDHGLIKQDLTKVGFAYHICELIDGLCAENQENRQVYFLLRRVLQELAGDTDILAAIHGFEIELLTLLGFYKHSEVLQHLNTTAFIEQILERKLKSRRMLHKFSQ